MTGVKSFVIAIIVLANMGSALVTPLVYLDFEMRRDYIAKVLCVERKQPITVCGGSCYLAAQLDKAKEHQEKSRQLTPKTFTFFFSEIRCFEWATDNLSPIQDLTFSALSEHFPKSRLAFDIFHPPRLG
ncbi:MAG: hypothetical protein RIC30_03215 [Marinoscillum sp.]|uniref:hypothetical protein n=1 Tax=Marinoscillum sp. TaxID=2024838 RepID=UPI0032FDF32F